MDRTVRIWDAATGTQTAAEPGTEVANPFVAYARDGKTLVEEGSEQIRFRNPTSAREARPRVVASHLNPLWSFSLGGGKSLSADGSLVASEDGGVIGVRKVDTGEKSARRERCTGRWSSWPSRRTAALLPLPLGFRTCNSGTRRTVRRFVDCRSENRASPRSRGASPPQT